MVTAGDLVIGADSHTCTYGALEGSVRAWLHRCGGGHGLGQVWLRVPRAISVVLKASCRSMRADVILHLIGMLGVDGALYRSLEFSGGRAGADHERPAVHRNMAIEAGG